MLIENNRALLGAIVFSFLSCTQEPQTSNVGGSPPIPAGSGAAVSANPEAAVLTLEDAPRSLEVKPISEALQLEGDAVCTSNGKYALEVAEGTFPKIARGTFVIRAGSSRRLIFRGSGWYARWVSEAEVAFLDASGQLTKLDVTDPPKETFRCHPRRHPPKMRGTATASCRSIRQPPDALRMCALSGFLWGMVAGSSS